MSIPNSGTGTGTASTGSSNSGQVVTVNPSYVVLKPGATRTPVSYTHLRAQKCDLHKNTSGFISSVPLV